jgi:hypothetical protein
MTAPNDPTISPDSNAVSVESTALLGDFVVCHVCHGSKKSPFGDWACQCCKGQGKLTKQEHHIKTTIMRDLARRLVTANSRSPNVPHHLPRKAGAAGATKEDAE